LRGLVDGTGLDWAQLGLAAIGSVGLMLLALWYLTAMLKRFRARGYITRYT
jgi:hypothetical protein